MNLKTLTLIAIAAWAPIVADADAETPPRQTTQMRSNIAKAESDTELKRCLSQKQILTELRRQGYRATAGDMKRNGGTYLVTAVRHRANVVVKVDRCTGRILSVQAAREAARRMPDTGALRKAPKLTLQCLSKQAVYQKLKDRGYNYLKLEQITGPYDTSKGKVYRAQTLVKAGPWCQVKLAVNCYNASLVEYQTLQDTCIY